ncbi:MAG: hypothetical protein LBG26_03075 [Treponema sp.]|nr:hypothetical protein [Treponema sp.]
MNLQRQQVNLSREALVTSTILKGISLANDFAASVFSMGRQIYNIQQQQQQMEFSKFQADTLNMVDEIRAKDDYNGNRGHIGEDGNWFDTDAQRGFMAQRMQEAEQRFGEKGVQKMDTLFYAIRVENEKAGRDALKKDTLNTGLAATQVLYDRQVASGTGDFSPVEAMIRTLPITDEAQNALIIAKKSQFQIDFTTNDAISIGRTQGIAKAEEYALQSGLPQETISAIMGKVQDADNKAVTAGKAAANQAFDEVLKNGGTPREAYDNATKTDSQNPDVISAIKAAADARLAKSNEDQFAQDLMSAETLEDYEALKEKHKSGGTYAANYIGQEAQQKKHDDTITALAEKKKLSILEERFYHEVNGATLDELKALKPNYAEGGEYEPAYEGYGKLQKERYDYISKRISDMEKAATPPAGKEPPYQNTLELAYKFRDGFWAGTLINKETKNPYTGPEVMAEIYKLDLKSEDRSEILRELLAGTDGKYTLAAQAFAGWDTYAAAEEAKLKPGSPERIELEKRHKDTRTMLGQMFFQGLVKPEDMRAFVEKSKNHEIAQMLDKGLTSGNIAEARRQSILGGFDRLQYLQYDENGNRYPAWVNGSEKIFNDLNVRDTQAVEDFLKAGDWKIDAPAGADTNTLGVFVEREPGDRTGEVIFNLKNGKGETATVRVGVNGTLEERVEEGGRTLWVPFDKKLSEGRTAKLARYEAALPADIKTKIENAARNALDGARTGDPAQYSDYLRVNLTKALGNRTSTEAGRAYIEAKMEEFRQNMNLKPAAPSMRGVGSQRNALRRRGL